MLDVQRLKGIKESLRVFEIAQGGQSIAVEMCHELLTHIDTLTARVAALEDALRPFRFDDLWFFPDDEDEEDLSVDVAIGHIRKARELIATTYPTNEEVG